MNRSPPAVRKIINQQSHQSPLLSLNNAGALSPASATTNIRSRSKSPAVQQRKENNGQVHKRMTVVNKSSSFY